MTYAASGKVCALHALSGIYSTDWLWGRGRAGTARQLPHAGRLLALGLVMSGGSALASPVLEQGSSVHSLPDTQIIVASAEADALTRVAILVTKGASGLSFKVETAPGVHINPEAPATLSGGTLSARLDVASGVFVLASPPPSGTLMQARFSLCDNGNTWCKPVSLSFTFQPDVPRPTLVMLGASSPAAQVRPGTSVTVLNQQAPQTPVKVEASHPMVFPGALQDDADAAFRRAVAEQKLVLIDFYGVWCPPCQLLVAQGLGDPRARSLLEKTVVLQVDADRDSSWALKSRYAITGYPTVLVTNAQGEELGRYLGFEDADAFVLWLGRTTASGKPLNAWISARRAGDRSAATLLGLARSLVALGLDEEAVPSYAEALPTLIGADAREARKALLEHAVAQKKADEARIQARALAVLTPPDVSTAYSLIAAGQTVAKLETAGAAAMGAEIVGLGLSACKKLLADPATPVLLQAQALEFLALEASERKAEAEARGFASQGADKLLSLERGLTGEGAERYALFRGQLHSLLDLLEASQRLQEAEAWYKKLIAAWPSEFTWHYRYAAFLEDAQRLDEAAREASLAKDTGYGDNRLRAVGRLARILKAQGKTEAARTLLKDTLETTHLPSDPTVRTHRYVKQLADQLARL